MLKVQEILPLGDKRVIVTDGPCNISYNDRVRIGGVEFHAIPPNGGYNDSFAIKGEGLCDYSKDFFLGKEVVVIRK